MDHEALIKALHFLRDFVWWVLAAGTLCFVLLAVFVASIPVWIEERNASQARRLADQIAGGGEWKVVKRSKGYLKELVLELRSLNGGRKQTISFRPDHSSIDALRNLKYGNVLRFKFVSDGACYLKSMTCDYLQLLAEH